MAAADVNRTQDTTGASLRQHVICTVCPDGGGPGSGVVPARRCRTASAGSQASEVSSTPTRTSQHLARFPETAIHAIIWKATLQRYGGAIAPFGAEPTPYAENADTLQRTLDVHLVQQTSSVHTGLPARCPPCDWVSWQPLYALKRSILMMPKAAATAGQSLDSLLLLSRKATYSGLSPVPLKLFIQNYLS